MAANDPLGGMLEGATAGEGTGAASLPFLPTRPLTATISVRTGTAASPTTVEEAREMPFDGWLAEVFIRWEDGCNSLVGVQLREGGPNENGRKLIPFNPQDEYTSLNDVSRVYALWLPADEGTPFTISVQNRDGDNGHAVPLEMVAAQYVEALHGDLPSNLKPPAVR